MREVMSLHKTRRKIEVLNWQSVAPQVQQVNSELATLINEVNPDKTLKLLKVTYQYGDLITHNGLMYLPNKQGLLESLQTLAQLDPTLRDIAYATIPMFLLLNRSAEIFIQHGERVVPLNLAKPGTLLGLFETMSYRNQLPDKSLWCVSAGSRSVFLLPKITERLGFQRLCKEFELSPHQPVRHLSDHWRLFTAIVQHEAFPEDWDFEVLFFTREWIKQKRDPLWQKFDDYIIQNAWKQASPAINRTYVSLQWRSAMEAMALRRLQMSTYIVEHAKHIITIANGYYPGIRPIIRTQEALPLASLQKIFVEIYGLSNYLPTFLHVAPLDTLEQGLPLYYSLNYPTLVEGSPEKKRSTTLFIDTKEIQLIIDTLRDNDKAAIENIYIRYFHTHPSADADVLSSTELVVLDKELAWNKELFPTLQFCTSSQFWRGCISIQKRVEKSL